MGMVKVDERILTALRRMARTIIERDEAEEPIRRGKDHYSVRDNFIQANGRYVDAARELAAVLDGEK